MYNYHDIISKERYGLIKKIVENQPDKLINWCYQNKELDFIKKIYNDYSWNIKINDKDDIYTSENLLHHCCRLGYLDIIKLIFKQGNIDLNEKNEEAILLSCENGHIDIVKWILSQKNTNIVGYSILLEHSIVSGNLELVEYLASYVEEVFLEKIIINCCIFSHSHIINWLLLEKNQILVKIDSTIVNQCFKFSCGAGNIEICKQIYSITSNKYNLNIEKAFLYACFNDCPEIAEWIYSIDSNLDLKSNDYEYLKIVCQNDNLEFAQWLTSKEKINKNLCKNIFFHACWNGYFDICRWINTFNLLDSDILYDIFFSICFKKCDLNLAKFLYSLGNIDYHRDNDLLFCKLCSAGDEYLDICKWLYSLGNIDIYQDDEYIFKVACSSNLTKMTKWLYSIAEFDIHINDNYCFKISIMNNNLELFQWLFNQITDVEQLDFSLLKKNCCKCNSLSILQFLAKKNKEIDTDNLFIIALYNRNLDILKWLYFNYDLILTKNYFNIASNLGKIEIIKWIYSIKRFNIEFQDLINICKNGNLELFKWMDNHRDKHVSVDWSKLFIISCGNQDLSLVQWIYRDVIDIKSLNEGFNYASEIGNKCVCVWLFTKFGDIVLTKDSFYYVCLSGDIELVKWFSNITNNILPEIKLESLVQSCEMGFTQVVKFIIKHSNIDIHYDDELLFRISCEKGYLDLAKYLLGLGNVKWRCKDDEAFTLACLNNHIEIVKLLCSIDTNYDFDENSLKDNLTPIIKDSYIYFLKNQKWSEIKKRLPIITTVKKECCVCYEDVEIQTKCQHQYCLKCLGKWYLLSQTCPYCTTEFLIDGCSIIE